MSDVNNHCPAIAYIVIFSCRCFAVCFLPDALSNDAVCNDSSYKLRSRPCYFCYIGDVVLIFF